jgi:hypothetical protein
LQAFEVFFNLEILDTIEQNIYNLTDFPFDLCRYPTKGASIMSSLDKARQTQLKNIEARTGKTLAELREIIASSGLKKHSELRQMLMERFALGYGDASNLVHFALQSDGQSAAQAADLSIDQMLDGIYTGSKAPLRPLHEAAMAAIHTLGEFEIVPKKTYLALRRKRQFAMVGPGTKGRLEIGLNMKGIEPTSRLEALPPGGMCQYRVFLASADELNAELFDWLKTAYDSAG